MPTTSKLYTDARLTGIAIEPSRQNSFVADEIAAPLDSVKQSDQIPVIDPERDKQRLLDDVVPKAGAAKIVDEDLGTPVTFFCDKHQLMGLVADEDVANANADVGPHLFDKVRTLSDRIKLVKDHKLLTLLRAGLTTGNGRAVEISDADKKWDSDLSDPLQQIQDAISDIEKRTGITCNRISMGAAVLRKLAMHPAVRATSQYVLAPDQQIGNLTTMANRIAGLVGLEKCVFSLVTVNLAAKGATASMEQLWEDDVLLYYYETPSKVRTNAGLALTPKWNVGDIRGTQGGYQGGMRVQRWRVEERDAEAIKVTEWYDHTIANLDAGFLIKSVLTSS